MMHLLERPWGIFLISWLLCLLTMSGHVSSLDEEIMFRVTESIATRGELSITPFYEEDGQTFASKQGVNGLEYAQYGLGNSLAAVPMYWIGNVACKFVSDEAIRNIFYFYDPFYLDPKSETYGHDLLKRLFVVANGGVLASLTAVLIFMFCKNLARAGVDTQSGSKISLWTDRVSGLTAVAYIAGTVALPHARTFLSEPIAGLFLLLTLYLLTIPAYTPLTIKRTFFAGTALAFAFLGRLDTLFAMPGVLLMLYFRLSARPFTNPRLVDLIIWRKYSLSNINLLLVFAIPTAIFVCWKLVINYLHFGNPFTNVYADQREGFGFSTSLLLGLYGYLFSVGKNLFLFSPAIIIGIMGWPTLYRYYKHFSIGLAVTIFSVLLIHSKWQNWAGGWCWGPRHVFIIHAMLIIPMAAFLHDAKPGRKVYVGFIMAIAFAVQIYGTSQDPTVYYMKYFYSPTTEPRANIMYGPEDLAPQFMMATMKLQNGKTVQLPFSAIPAPLKDSIFVPHNSVWYRYAEMWRAGRNDNFWLHL